MTRLTNWAGNHAYGAASVHRPTSLDELQQIVSDATSVRVLGSRHSFTDIGDADALIDMRSIERPTIVDTTAQTVTVRGAATYAEVAAPLQPHGLALHNLASLPHISVAGAISTATHGSGVGNANLATAVLGLTIVDGSGDLRTFDRADPDLAGAAVSLGALGPIVDVTLGLVPDFEISQTVIDDVPVDAVVAHLHAVMSAAYSVSVFTTYDDIGQVWAKHRVGDEDRVQSLAGDLGGTRAAASRHPVPGLDGSTCTDQTGTPGRWADRLPHFQMGFTPSAGNEVQSEFFVDQADGPAAIEALRRDRSGFASQMMVSEVRAVAADDLWMSPQYGRNTVAFHFTWHPDGHDGPGVDAAVSAVESALAPFGAVPHWGKVFHAEAFTPSKAYERHVDFVDLVERCDPDGRFRNAWWNRHIH